MKYFVAINLAVNKEVQIRIIKSIVFRNAQFSHRNKCSFWF